MTFKLLSKPTDNPKVAKNIGVNVLTAPLHLAPANLSGYEVCPLRSAGCTAACLHTTGNPAFMQAKNTARIRKTKEFFENRKVFMTQLTSDIEKLQAQAEELGMQCGVRLNATSDLPWEVYPVEYKGKTYKNIFEAFPNVSFMDYTKVWKRALKVLPKNYHLTFSLSESNLKDAEKAYTAGLNVAVVFKKVPTHYHLGSHKDVPVIDGDLHDWRPFDPKGVIVGLKAKGKARNDTTGFVK